MLRFLLKMMLMTWFSVVVLLLIMLPLGKTAPEISKLAFFAQELDGTDYWRMDLFTGVSFKDAYSGRVFIPQTIQSPIQHFLTISSDANYNRVSETNLYSQDLRFIWQYPSRGYDLILAGDYAFTIDRANFWRRIHLPSGGILGFGRYSNLDNPQISPDAQWMAGRIYNDNMLFINVIDGNSYEIPSACCVQWSPDSQWFIASNASGSSISVFRSSDGAIHPTFPQNFPASAARWSPDGQSIIFYLNSAPLSTIALDNNEIRDYPNQAEDYQLDCLSPNQRYIITWEFETVDYNINLNLEDTETGQTVWALRRRNFSGFPQCVWSSDSRYLAFYASVINDGLRRERVFFIDTLTKRSWNLYPSNLTTEAQYLHIPD